MIALGTIADLKPREIWKQLDEVISVIDRGTIITLVWGIKTLAKVASTKKQYREKLSCFNATIESSSKNLSISMTKEKPIYEADHATLSN